MKPKTEKIDLNNLENETYTSKFIRFLTTTKSSCGQECEKRKERVKGISNFTNNNKSIISETNHGRLNQFQQSKKITSFLNGGKDEEKGKFNKENRENSFKKKFERSINLVSNENDYHCKRSFLFQQKSYDSKINCDTTKNIRLFSASPERKK